jgi:hypothetical protein
MGPLCSWGPRETAQHVYALRRTEASSYYLTNINSCCYTIELSTHHSIETGNLTRMCTWFTWKCFWHLRHRIWYCFDNYFTYFVPVFKYCYSDSRSLWTVMSAGGLKSDSTHHFFRNACTQSGSLRFSQFSGCWLILFVYIIMSFYFARSLVILLLPLFNLI